MEVIKKGTMPDGTKFRLKIGWVIIQAFIQLTLSQHIQF